MGDSTRDLVAEIGRLRDALCRRGHVMAQDNLSPDSVLTRAAAEIRKAWDCAAEWELECIEARADRDRLRQDRERLDWLSGGVEVRWDVWPDGQATIYLENDDGIDASSLRAAIDAARGGRMETGAPSLPVTVDDIDLLTRAAARAAGSRAAVKRAIGRFEDALNNSWIRDTTGASLVPDPEADLTAARQALLDLYHPAPEGVEGEDAGFIADRD